MFPANRAESGGDVAALGGRPFGDGTPPGPPAPAEVVPANHTA